MGNRLLRPHRGGQEYTAPRFPLVVDIAPHLPTLAGGFTQVSPVRSLRLGEGLSGRERSERLREGVRVGWLMSGRVGRALRGA